MPSVVVTAIVFGCVFGGALAGLFIGGRLPPHHLDDETQRIVKLSMGTVAALSALVLGLLVSSAKSGFDAIDTEVTHSCANLIQLDGVLLRYGPETAEARHELRVYIAGKLDERWPQEAHAPATVDPGVHLQRAQDLLLLLRPANAVQRRLQSRALDLASDLGQTRWLLVEQSTRHSIPTPFLVILVFWATVLFISFGVFAPHNATVVVALLVSALSLAGALFLVLELERPFGGVIHISSAPVRRALSLVDR